MKFVKCKFKLKESVSAANLVQSSKNTLPLNYNNYWSNFVRVNHNLLRKRVNDLSCLSSVSRAIAINPH